MKYVLSLFLMLLTVMAQAVSFSSNPLNTSNGLPENNVRCLLSDADGYIWMGSPNGLYRYDGNFFRTFRHAESGNTSLLFSNHINRIVAASDHQLLLCHPSSQYSLYDTRKECFVEADDSVKIRLYRQAMLPRQETTIPDSLRHIVSEGGNIIYDNLWNPIVVAPTGTIWWIGRDGQRVIRMQVFDERLFALTQSHKYKVLTLPEQGITLVSTNGCGITLCEHSTQSIHHIDASSGLVDTNYILDMCADLNGNIWVADEFHGLHQLCFEPERAQVALLRPDSAEPHANQVHVVHQLAPGKILAANTAREAFEWQPGEGKAPRPFNGELDVHCVATDRNGGLWIGSRTRGLRTPDGSWISHTGGDTLHSPSTNTIQRLLFDNKGRLWAGGRSGVLDLVEEQADGSVTFRHIPLGVGSINALLEDDNHQLWIGSDEALLIANPDELERESHTVRTLLNSHDLQGYEVKCICQDSRHIVWIGTDGGGIFYTSDGGKTFARLSRRYGLISDQIQTIIQDVYGTMWIATTDGMSLYNPDTREHSYFFSHSRLPQNYYSNQCAIQLADSSLAFGTNQGIVTYRPSATYSLHPRKHTLAITDILIGGVSASEGDDDMQSFRPVTLQKSIILTHRQNSPTFHFSDFSYRFNRGTRYTCLLEGYDKGWSELSPLGSVSYRNLPSGHYRLHIRSVGYDGEDELLLAVSVLRPWWLRWWAWLAYAVLLTAILAFTWHHFHTIYSLRRRLNFEKKLNNFKLQFFTNIAHEFRTPLSIIRGSMDHIIESDQLPPALNGPVGAMQKSTARMMRLVNQLLEFRKMQNDQLTLALESTEVVGFARDVFDCFSDAAEVKELDYSFLSSVEECTLNVDRQHLDKILYNLLSNAIKYTPAGGKVSMLLQVDEQFLTITVTDTGVGIPPDKQGQLFSRYAQSVFSSDSFGIGLHLSKALAERHGGTICYEANKPQGSIFTVRLPSDDAAYSPDDFLRPSELNPTDPRAAEDVEEMRLDPMPMNQSTVMVVEDDDDYCHYLQTLLQHYFKVHAFTQATDALEVISRNAQPDLIISDVKMPGMNGLEFTRRVRRNPDTLSLPILLLTGLDGEEQHIEAVRMGADAFLTKPCSEKLLVMTCKRLIDRYRQTQQAAPTQTIPVPETIIDSRDRRLLDKLNFWLKQNISDSNISVDDIAAKMGYNRTIFYQKVKSLTGQTPADYVRTIRLNWAAQLLGQGELSISEVAYRVGFSDSHYFSRLFKKQFGKSPRDYVSQQQTQQQDKETDTEEVETNDNNNSNTD